MNVRSAENLIACHREGIRPESSVQKALKMAEDDEQMREILKTNAAFDEQIVSAIHFIKPPETLRKKIAECAGSKELRKNAMHPAILCAIAGVLLGIGFLVYLEMEKRAGFPGKENAARMIDQLNRMTGMELEMKSGTVGGLADWFMLRGFDEMRLPNDLASLPAAGARTFMSADHSVGQIAIGVEKLAPILNVFRASDFSVELEDGADWKVFSQAEWAAAIRQRGGICTMIAFRGSEEEMKGFLTTLRP